MNALELVLGQYHIHKIDYAQDQDQIAIHKESLADISGLILDQSYSKISCICFLAHNLRSRVHVFVKVT